MSATDALSADGKGHVEQNCADVGSLSAALSARVLAVCHATAHVSS